MCTPQILRASSLEWEDSRQQMQLEAQTRLVFAPTGRPFIDDLLLGESLPETVLVMTHRALKITPANVPILALPEPGTLLLLGLGLAGRGSLMRKKKNDSS